MSAGGQRSARPAVAAKGSEAARLREAREARQLSDPELLVRLARGEVGALGAIYDRYRADVSHFVERMAPRASDHDDLVHETFLALVGAARSFDGRASARPFVLGVAAFVLRRRRRSWRRLAEVLRAFGERFSTVSPTTPEEESEAAEKRVRIESALMKLSHEKREVFMMVEGEGLSGDDIATALGIPVATVWTRLHHARKELRRSLGRGAP